MNRSKLKTLRKQLYAQYLASWFLNTAYVPDHGPVPSWHDVRKILIYDRKKKKNPHTPLPQMRTLGGENLLSQLLDAYEDAKPVGDSVYAKELLKSSGWHCACGRVNPKYTYTCACGRGKRDAAIQEERDAAGRTAAAVSSCWHCICGRTNLSHRTTCACGRKKNDVPISHRYPLAKEKTWHCSCGRTNPSYTSTCVCGKNKREIKTP